MLESATPYDSSMLAWLSASARLLHVQPCMNLMSACQSMAGEIAGSLAFADAIKSSAGMDAQCRQKCCRALAGLCLVRFALHLQLRITMKLPLISKHCMLLHICIGVQAI